MDVMKVLYVTANHSDLVQELAVNFDVKLHFKPHLYNFIHSLALGKSHLQKRKYLKILKHQKRVCPKLPPATIQSSNINMYRWCRVQMNSLLFLF